MKKLLGRLKGLLAISLSLIIALQCNAIQVYAASCSATALGFGNADIEVGNGDSIDVMTGGGFIIEEGSEYIGEYFERKVASGGKPIYRSQADQLDALLGTSERDLSQETGYTDTGLVTENNLEVIQDAPAHYKFHVMSEVDTSSYQHNNQDWGYLTKARIVLVPEVISIHYMSEDVVEVDTDFVDYNSDGMTVKATSEVIGIGSYPLGHHPKGWLVDGSSEKAIADGEPIPDEFFPEDAETNDIYLYPDFVPNVFTLVFDGNGGTVNYDQDDFVTLYNEAAGSDAISIGEETAGATRVGYTFKGWAETSTSTTAITEVIADYSDAENIKTVYAIWERNIYTAHYAGDLETNTYVDTDVLINANAGRYTARLATKDVTIGWSVPTGFHAAGWGDTAGSKFDFGEDIFVAAYRLNDVATSGDPLFSLSLRYAPNTSTVKFNGNGGTCNIDDVSAEYDPDGTNAITIPTAADVATRTGYIFKGWSKTPNGNLDLVGSSLTLDFTEEETVTTLYAQWDPIPFTLAFNSNGGEGSMDAVAGKAGFRMELPANAFAKTGYTFLGWATTADATTPEYADGAQYSYLPSNEDETITLYAVWQEKEPELPGRQLVGLGRVYLTAGQEYYFGSDGTYSVDGDTSAYAPGITFYVPESGYYTISIQ